MRIVPRGEFDKHRLICVIELAFVCDVKTVLDGGLLGVGFYTDLQKKYRKAKCKYEYYPDFNVFCVHVILGVGRVKFVDIVFCSMAIIFDIAKIANFPLIFLQCRPVLCKLGGNRPEGVVWPFIFALAYRGQVAQLVEQWTENPCVGGSNPPLPISVTH